MGKLTTEYVIDTLTSLGEAIAMTAKTLDLALVDDTEVLSALCTIKAPGLTDQIAINSDSSEAEAIAIATILCGRIDRYRADLNKLGFDADALCIPTHVEDIMKYLQDREQS